MHMRIPFALAAAGLILAAAPALAAGRDERPPRISETAPAIIAVPAAALPALAPDVSVHQSGAIHSSNTVSTDTGGNSGSNIVTGDQSSSVTVVNIGPGTSNSIVSSNPSAPQPDTQCSGRACPRTR
jgi:hypothetical protein